ncbi:MAG TPA: RNA polymerase subunit sigma-24, partial [Paludibacteraceae bacterium]|nr:RNA polymerase subunit sigma-24 [Paludibacteraceae bacterium]
MRFYENMSFKEIAESNQISINTALGRMRYAILNLRKYAAERNLLIDFEKIT